MFQVPRSEDIVEYGVNPFKIEGRYKSPLDDLDGDDVHALLAQQPPLTPDGYRPPPIRRKRKQA